MLKTFLKTIFPPVLWIAYPTYHFLSKLVSRLLYWPPSSEHCQGLAQNLFGLQTHQALAPVYLSDLIFHHHPSPPRIQVQDTATLNLHFLKYIPFLTHSLHVPFPPPETFFPGFFTYSSFRSQKGRKLFRTFLSTFCPHVFSQKPILITGTSYALL